MEMSIKKDRRNFVMWNVIITQNELPSVSV